MGQWLSDNVNCVHVCQTSTPHYNKDMVVKPTDLRTIWILWIIATVKYDITESRCFLGSWELMELFYIIDARVNSSEQSEVSAKHIWYSAGLVYQNIRVVMFSNRTTMQYNGMWQTQQTRIWLNINPLQQSRVSAKRNTMVLHTSLAKQFLWVWVHMSLRIHNEVISLVICQ